MRWRDIAGTGNSTGAHRQLGWFATLFAMALVFHYTDGLPRAVLPAQLAVLLAALPVLIFPGSPAAVGLAVGAGAAVPILHLPAASNHFLLSLLIALTLGATALVVRGARSVERVLYTARTPAVLVLLVVYFFTVFDKLNTAFFTPAVSCGSALVSQLIWLNGFGHVTLSPVAAQFAAIATVVTEAAIMVALAVPRLRYWGVLLGVVFHSMLALAAFYDFSTVVFAVYTLLVPTALFDTVPSWLRPVMLAGFTAHVLMSFGASVGDSPRSPIGLPWHTLLVVTWAVAVLPIMVAVLRGYRTARGTGIETPSWQLRPVAVLLVPLLAFANGATSYAGLNTVANYSMFSNLHTEEGATNHLLPGVTRVQLTDYQRDTVTVTGLGYPEHIHLDPLHRALGGMTYLQRQSRWASELPPVRIPWLELRRTVLLWQRAGISGVRIAYLRDGQQHEALDATTDPVLAAPLPWWQRHLLAFRAIDSGRGPDACRW